MNEPSYSLKEIIEIQFSTLRKDLQDIKNTLEKQNVETEKRFSSIEKDIDELRLDNARYKIVWGIGVTLGASCIATLVALAANRIF